MSFFTEDKEAIKKAVEFFNDLSSERQAYLASNLAKPDAKFEQNEIDNFLPVVQAIRNDMTSHNTATIVSELIDLGMDKTYAMILVENIVKEAPTTEYEIQLISKISDEDFKTKMPEFVKLVWVENTKSKEVSEKLGLTIAENNALADLFRNAMTEYLRSESSIQIIANKLTKEGFSESKVDTFTNTLKINSEHWRNFLVFSNTQDVYFKTNEIEEQNREILKLMRDMLKLFRNDDDSSSLGHYQ